MGNGINEKKINRKTNFSHFCIFAVILFLLSDGLPAQVRDLNYFIGVALQNSPLLNDYRNQVVINRLDSLIHKAVYKPQVDFSSTNIYAPNINGWGYDVGIIDNGTFNALLSVRQSIMGRGNRKSQLQAYNLENQALQNTSKITVKDLKLAVTAQYLAAYGILSEIQYSEEIESLMKKEETLLRVLAQKTVYKQTDYLNFQVGLQQQQLTTRQQRADYRNNIALLNYLCGIADTTVIHLESPDIRLQSPPSFETTLQYNSFLIDSLKITNSDALIDYAYRPRLDVFADAGFNSQLTYEPYKNFGASIGLSLVIPIYDGGQRQKQHDKLRVLEQTRKYYLDFSRKQYQQQLGQLYQQLEQTETIIRHAETVVKSAQTLMEAYKKQMQTGDASITDYILSINNYLNAIHVITQNANNKFQIINQINYWNDEK